MGIDEATVSGHGDALYAALRARDHAAATDELAAIGALPPAVCVAVVTAVARRAVAELAPLDEPAVITVDALARRLLARTGSTVPADLDADLGLGEAERIRTRLDALAAADADTLRAALRTAYAELDALRDERLVLEDRLAELAGARVLADTLAAELERDEWIRARLRKVKATPPARAAIKLRQKLRGGG